MKQTVFIIALLIAFPLVIRAQYPSQENALNGMRGLKVLVWDVNSDLKKIGLDSDTVKTDMELHLRKAGIPILAGKEWPKNYNKAVLIASTLTIKEPDSVVFSVAVKVQLWRIIEGSDDSVMWVSTWEKMGIGLFGESIVRREVRNEITDDVDEFANDYLAANPK